MSKTPLNMKTNLHPAPTLQGDTLMSGRTDSTSPSNEYTPENDDVGDRDAGKEPWRCRMYV